MSEKDSCIVLCLKLTDCGELDVDDNVVGIDPLLNDTTELLSTIPEEEEVDDVAKKLSLPCVC